MSQQAVITDEDRALAQKCMNCPVCSRARRKQKGTACQAYERVYGRKAHEPMH